MSIWKGKYGPLLIAEIGGNHEGDFGYAFELTRLAVESEADYIKFQIYTGDSIVNPHVSPDRNAHFKKFELTPEQHSQLAEYCINHGKGYIASVWDMKAFDWIDPFLKMYKVGSGDMTAYPFLKKIARTGKPIILSTGLAKFEEIIDSIDYLKAANPVYEDRQMIAILQCTSMYPIPLSDANLEVIREIKERTGYITGFSDHTVGLTALKTAYAMGAEILEFHFTDKRKGKTFRDHKVSLTKQEINQLTEKISLINTLKGSRIKRPLDIEGDHVVSFRRAIYPVSDIPAGTIIEPEHLKSLRPNNGIDAREYDRLIGKRSRVEIQKDQILDWTYFEDSI